MRRLGILKEFDKTSQSYEIRKYCKNIGMQKLTFEECSISLQSTDLLHFLLHESKFNCMPEKKVLNQCLTQPKKTGSRSLETGNLPKAGNFFHYCILRHTM